MGHDTSKIQLGATYSSDLLADSKVGTVEAGKAVVLEDDDTLSTDTSEGSYVGVSLGRDQSNTNKTSFAKRGTKIPLLLKTGFDPTIGDPVAIEDDTGLAKAYTGTGDQYINAVWASERKTAIKEDGTTHDNGVALIDMVGGA